MNCSHSSDSADGEIEARPGALSHGWLVGLLLGSMAFTVVGSLVPFEFRARELGEAVNSFCWAMTHRLMVESRSDGIANVLLGIPFGFALLGVLLSDGARSRSEVLLRSLTVLATCLAFAATVEFTQLFAPTRTCCGSDVLAQGLGAIIGMTIWFAFGPTIRREVDLVMIGGGATSRLLVLYLALFGFTQALPLDLTLSPYAAYHKFREGRLILTPFHELSNPSAIERWAHVATLLKLAVLYLPVGLLAGLVPGWSSDRAHAGKLALLGLVLATAIEAGHVLAQSRTASVTEVLVGVAAMVVGWLCARFRAARVYSIGRAIVLGSLWLVAVAVTSWQPFAFEPVCQPFNWTPGSPLEGREPFVALEEMATKLVLFGLGGALAASLRAPGATCGGFTAAIGWGIAIATVAEIGQQYLSGHSPCVTDVLLGGLGSFLGFWIASRVGEGPTQTNGLVKS